MRELTEQEMEQVTGAGWDDVGTILGGVAAVGAGAVYTAKTGGIGGYFGGGLMMSGGLTAISAGFDGLHDEWYSGS